MALVAVCVDYSVATVASLKYGHCNINPFLSREACCRIAGEENEQGNCAEFVLWGGSSFGRAFGIYVGWAVAFGVVSSCITMLSRRELPSISPGLGDMHNHVVESRNGKSWVSVTNEEQETDQEVKIETKSLYMAAGSGIPEIKTILTGWVIPHFLDARTFLCKAVGSIFSVATGMALGKEGPYIHMAACVGNFVAMRFEKYRQNGKQFREILTASSAAGLSAAFGAPIGGVLFAYEELAYFFPRKVLWRTFLCSMVAAIALRALNPHKTGKLVLFETDYNTNYHTYHYVFFVLIGICGGLWGGTFTRANQIWARWFRGLHVIKNYPVFETFLVIMITAGLQFPNPVTRAPGEAIIRSLLSDCSNLERASWICEQERAGVNWTYRGWLLYGTLSQLFSTTITFGVKVPAGIIVPSLCAGSLFGRLVGQWAATGGSSAGIFAMVGAGAFLGGVTRMTISLCVVMFELTGSLEYVVPHMIAILAAKWTADAVSRDSIYDLAQSVLGHPFLSEDEALDLLVEHDAATVEELIPPRETMHEVTVHVPHSNKVSRRLLTHKLEVLERRGLMDGGLVLVQGDMVLQGYIAQPELEFGLGELGKAFPADVDVRLLGDSTAALDDEPEFDLSRFVDRAPVTISAKAPMEVAVELFTKVGIRYLCLTEEGTGRLVGFVIKKRVVRWLDGLKRH